MVDQIFISHSAKDREIINFFTKKFDDTGVKPVLMEYEKWSRSGKPNWMWIKDELKKSKALFLLLTKNIVKKEQTQNWVAFEIGVAAASEPPIPVYVFKEQKVDFAVPYVNHYFHQPRSNTGHLMKRDFSETFLNLFIYAFQESFIDAVIKGQDLGIVEEIASTCPNCLLKFQYWSFSEEKFECPCCKTIIIRMLEDEPGGNL